MKNEYLLKIQKKTLQLKPVAFIHVYSFGIKENLIMHGIHRNRLLY